MAQAARFGNRWALRAAAALLWPLVASLIFPNPTFTIVVYVIALVVDVVLFVVWLRRALRYSRQAARGESFSLKR